MNLGWIKLGVSSVNSRKTFQDADKRTRPSGVVKVYDFIMRAIKACMSSIFNRGFPEMVVMDGIKEKGCEFLRRRNLIAGGKGNGLRSTGDMILSKGRNIIFKRIVNRITKT